MLPSIFLLIVPFNLYILFKKQKCLKVNAQEISLETATLPQKVLFKFQWIHHEIPHIFLTVTEYIEIIQRQRIVSDTSTSNAKLTISGRNSFPLASANKYRAQHDRGRCISGFKCRF